MSQLTEKVLHKIASQYAGVDAAKIVFIPPSATAATNVTNLNAALASYAVVIVSGSYPVNATINVPSTSCLLGMPTAFIYYQGAAVSTYVVKVTGHASNGGAYRPAPLQSLWINGSAACRGVQFKGWYNGVMYHDLHISEATEVGIDLVDCWGSRGSNLFIRSSKAIAMRTWRCNSMLLSGVHIFVHALFWSNNQGIVTDATLWALACDSGQAAAIAAWPAQYTVDFPDPADTTVVDTSSAYVQTSVAQQAAIVLIDGDLTHFDNVLTENVAIGDYPLFYIECSTTTVSHLRTENNYHGDAIVKIVGDGATSGTNIHFDQSVIGSTKHAACFADLTGTTRYVQLTNIQHHSSQLSSCHIRLTSGTHYYPSVKNCFAANISEQNRIIALPGATHIPAADFSTLVLPSGDTTGAEDLAAIQGALNTYGAAQLINGTYYVNAAIAMNANEQSLFGQGNLTQIRHYNNSTPIIKITKSRITIRDVHIYGGTYGIEIDGEGVASQAITNEFDNVWVFGATSHGLYGHGKTWTNRIIGGSFSSNTGDGINFVGTTNDANGNAIAIVGTRLSSNGGHGLAWCGTGLHIAGCCIELNGDSGIYIHTVNNRNTVGASIQGNYLEQNAIASIELETTTGEVISGVNVDGNTMTNPTVPNVLATGITGSIYYLHLGPGNYYNVSGGADPIQLGDICVSSTIYGSYESELTMTNRESNVVHFRRSSSPVITERRNVNAAAGGVGQTTNLVTLPAGAIIHDVVAHTVVAFNGNTTKTLDVGVAGNINKYIDKTDFLPGTLNATATMAAGVNNDQRTTEFLTSALTLIATWTNTASASAGSVDIYITYSMRPAAAQ